MNRPPTVSVVMPVYNGARYLRQAIASIRWQTFTDWELVCVDDGSTDNSAEILTEFAATDSRIKFVSQTNQGVVAARNHCSQLARGEWLACLDCDDIALPKRLAEQLSYVNRHPEVVAVGSNMLCVDPEGLPIQTTNYAARHADIEQGLLQGTGNTLGQPSVMMRRDAVTKAGNYRAEFQWIEDTDLWLRLARVGQLANMTDVLTYYRLHEQSTCWKRRGLQRTLMPKLIAEAHRVRGLPVPETNTKAETSPRKQSTAAGKWARQAARSGHYRSAWKHWRRQVAVEPLSLLTCRVTLETMFRACESFLKKSPAPLAPLPDWRRWDAPRGETLIESDRAA